MIIEFPLSGKSIPILKKNSQFLEKKPEKGIRFQKKSSQFWKKWPGFRKKIQNILATHRDTCTAMLMNGCRLLVCSELFIAFLK